MSKEKGKLNPRRGRERPTLKNFLPKISSSNRAEIGSGKAADTETKATHFLGKKNPEKSGKNPVLHFFPIVPKKKNR